MAKQWRTGAKVGRTIYKCADAAFPETLIGMMDSRELADVAVRAVNAHEDLVAVVKRLVTGAHACAHEQPQSLCVYCEGRAALKKAEASNG